MRKLTLFTLLVGVFACTDTPLVGPSTDGEPQPLFSMVGDAAPALMSTIDYVFAGHLGQFDADGRLLVWDGTIDGEVNGQILWWFVLGAGPPNKPPQALVGFYEARWEIWDGETLLMAGNSSGTTAKPPGLDGIWRGKGIVTEANADYAEWIGRPMFEDGNVAWAFPYSGQGTFRIN
ncbi:MAG: hypothetical protein OEZ65_17170 [Gemmatimonadota bacterium]|nr:hypothetical protein [Gemmatimonadota bacterium]